MIIIFILVAIIVFIALFVVFKLEKIYNTNYNYCIDSIMRRDDNFITFEDSIRDLDLPLISIEIDEGMYYFLVDSGANYNFITSSLYNTISHVTKEVPCNSTVITSNGSTESKTVILDFSLLNIVYTSKFDVVKSLEEGFNDVTHATSYTISGIIGNSFLSENNYVLDFNKKIMYIKNKYK